MTYIYTLNIVNVYCLLMTPLCTYSHKNTNYRALCIQEDLLTLYNWFKANKLTLDIGKSVCMHFGKGKEDNQSIRIGSETLPMVTHTKFLGIWIDNSLSWQQHFDQLYIKIIRNTNLLKVSKYHLNKSTKKLIYYTQVFSHLVYGITTWGNMLRSEQIQKLQKLQNKCIPLITGTKMITKEYQSLGIMKIPKLISLQNLKLGFKVQHLQLPYHDQNSLCN